MKKIMTGTLMACLCVASGTPMAAQEDPLAAAFEHFIEQARAAEAHLREHPFFESEVEQGAAYLHLSRMLVKGIKQELLQDADFPYFRVLDFFAREGGDNPDQRYLFSPIRGDTAYRVWGTRGSADRIEIQLYAGEPWAGTGTSAGFLGIEDINFDDDGNFSVIIAGDSHPGALLHNPPDATEIIVRQIYRDWRAAEPGSIHIDRIGYEGRMRPVETAADIAERLRRAARVARVSAETWPQFVQQRYVEAHPANEISGLLDTASLGGVPGRWMASGHFDIPAGHALVVRTWPTAAQYQGIQLTDRWFASLEYGNRISSLTDRQSIPAEDGSYYYVISDEDPGHSNWLDTQGLRKGTILLRFDGVRGDIPEDRWPTSQLVRIETLPERIPGFAAQREGDRAEQLRERRQHLQLRFSR